MGTLHDDLVAVKKSGGGSKESGWYSRVELGELWHQVHVERTGQPDYLPSMGYRDSGVFCWLRGQESMRMCELTQGLEAGLPRRLSL